MTFRVNETATVDEGAVIGEGTSIWHYVHVRSGSVIGDDCIVGQAAYIDEGVTIGSRVKIQNKVSIYHGVSVGDDVFIGPHVCFTNDMYPRAFNPDWKITKTQVERGVSIGANATIRCGVTIGEFAMIGAGSLVTKDVPPFALFVGSPGKVIGHVCYCGEVINSDLSVQKGNSDVPICTHNPDLDLSRFARS